MTLTRTIIIHIPLTSLVRNVIRPYRSRHATNRLRSWNPLRATPPGWRTPRRTDTAVSAQFLTELSRAIRVCKERSKDKTLIGNGEVELSSDTYWTHIRYKRQPRE